MKSYKLATAWQFPGRIVFQILDLATEETEVFQEMEG